MQGGSEAWKATRERPDSPDLILHIELGVPPLGGVGRPVTKHKEPSLHKLAGARWRPMLSTHPYTGNIRGNRGPFRGCVVVSTKLSGSNPDARTKRPDDAVVCSSVLGKRLDPGVTRTTKLVSTEFVQELSGMVFWSAPQNCHRIRPLRLSCLSDAKGCVCKRLGT